MKYFRNFLKIISNEFLEITVQFFALQYRRLHFVIDSVVLLTIIACEQMIIHACIDD